ncbi:MAG: type II toxin-antitoxin system RelE/ParE family toxin [Clostridia bacterium]|nr:type II toxin-antitoxin system RelE/ParE family toxin [Clostridia bacterium]
MNCRIILTETAKEDIRNIAFYITEQTKDKAVAAGFVKELQKKYKILEAFPECGSVPKDRVMVSSGYRYLTHKNYLIFYTYEKEEKTVYILAVFNAKRDYMRVMKRFI